MKKSILIIPLCAVLLFSCKEEIAAPIPAEILEIEPEPVVEPPEPKEIRYTMTDAKQWLAAHTTDSLQQAILFAINRTDYWNFSQMDSVILPDDLTEALAFYLPFPTHCPYLIDIHKVIFFSYAAQTFAAYKNGVLIRTGPTNMGREKFLTPTGLFYTNWKAKESISTVNDEWLLRWNFNLLNKKGIGWHQYSLPGYPESHSCLRLQEEDAKFLYSWADQWILENDFIIRAQGTPAIIFGEYDFAAPKPWLQLLDNPHALDISVEALQKTTEPYLLEMLAAQQTREFESLKKNKQLVPFFILDSVFKD